MTIIETLKSAPNRVAERRIQLEIHARKRAKTAHIHSVDRLWQVRTQTLERIDTLLVQANEVPVLKRVTSPAGRIVSKGLEAATAVHIDDYDAMNARKAIQAIRDVTGQRVALHNIRRHELTHKNRKTVLGVIDTLLAREIAQNAA
jgi:hypothetical protein